ncbi:MAG: HPr-rel-A system PqqD family peptide chaperone [Alphaproteobacteria bacterium]|nr:HPr-rel-A system PqqD family peptide chaperone [Alphaproteobacteria bacterium]MBU1525170.1 HPr-rel-A system PqqD family peptide chaperone [Alphaproteobacteria bacterium]MBU2352166.1 HPr-rel-A system PqqD family peptide chaperone [Alphaproteobacteria bacterium]MBU2381176.1 HPr-rel-A system PqqD family peptide chaperone [Alphaproteobacteria bacterium]
MADDACIFHAESGKYWTFTRTSARVWDLLAQPRSLRALVTALAEEFDAPRAAVERDVEAFVAFLMERRLVRLSEPARE